jgi:hypothetical protein
MNGRIVYTCTLSRSHSLLKTFSFFIFLFFVSFWKISSCAPESKTEWPWCIYYIYAIQLCARLPAKRWYGINNKGETAAGWSTVDTASIITQRRQWMCCRRSYIWVPFSNCQRADLCFIVIVSLLLYSLSLGGYNIITAMALFKCQ